MAKTNIPRLLTACKCEVPARARQVESGFVEQIGDSLGGIDTYQTSANVPQSQKRCISIILRSILTKSESKSKHCDRASVHRSSFTLWARAGRSSQMLHCLSQMPLPKFSPGSYLLDGNGFFPPDVICGSGFLDLAIFPAFSNARVTFWTQPCNKQDLQRNVVLHLFQT